MAEMKLWIPDKVKIEALNPKNFQRMIDRLVFGYYRYEINQHPVTRNYLKRIKHKLEMYERTKNQEYLIDVANYCLREIDHPSMSGTFFKSTDSHGRNRD